MALPKNVAKEVRGLQEEGFLMAEDTYDPLDNAFKSYSVAIRALRLQGIREGKLEPRLDDEEEVAVAVEAGFKIVQASHHRRSA